jgi:phenylpropionate dioxygenase-like ring-hydroxylating dioxygenase large terminal subunit
MGKSEREIPHAFLRNAWYPIAWAGEIADQPFGRTVLSEPIVLFRQDTGELSAVGGRCPHRFAPLRLGKVIDNRIECPYHGLMFDGNGRCVVNPHDSFLPKASVRSYPLIERYGLVWLWMGYPERVDKSLIPDFNFIDDPAYEHVSGTVYGEGHYELYSDNILDLSHAAYLHSGLNAPIFTKGERKFEQEGNRVWTRLFMPDTMPSEITAVMCDVVGRKQDHWVDVRWDAPAAMMVAGLTADPGQPKSEASNAPTMHIFTPESEHATYYFWAAAWKRRNDSAFADSVRNGLVRAFENEDKPMIREQSRLMQGADFWSLDPILLKGDSGAVRARRTLERLITAEDVPGNSSATSTSQNVG